LIDYTHGIYLFSSCLFSTLTLEVGQGVQPVTIAAQTVPVLAWNKWG